ncbi:uncharacterized protein [Epargyreus clarus]|uniref:uncharacterized protein n=1 Tax=Epargyreus clarus TaxID=520877 RepID=UPI003C2F0679
MLSRPSIYNPYNDEDEEEFALEDDNGIQWSNIIFLPFHSVFKLFVLISVIIKTILGPIQSVYPIVYCWNVMSLNPHLHIIQYLYMYCCDPIYGIDTFLHMVHRQVTDEAMKREYLPKSAFLLILDVISIVPLIRLVTNETCPPVQLWPNILTFSEFIIVYRIAEYFSMLTTHSSWRLYVGYTLILLISINCITCFLLLLTASGLCANCKNGIHDWRKYVAHKFNETDENYTTYVYAAAAVYSYITNKQLDETKASTYMEYIIMTIFLMAGYMVWTFIMFPKMFAEAILKMRRICIYYPIVERIIEETERRNPSSKAYLDVKNFYSLIWKKRGGITNIPEIISELPKYLRVEIRLDLVWPIFHHSPTFRKTSIPFKRWICEHIHLDYKLPGERFFAGPHCHTHLYYIKTGIVQLISADDGITPLLSVTGGTIFGDISCYLPQIKRKVIVRCLTYCEVLYVTRVDILTSLHMYPDDRRLVMENAKDRIKHARTLYTCKQHVRGLDRTEDEGIAWIKRRWWQISDTVSKWKRRPIKKEKAKCEMPPEEAVYHCAKYIGQLVLCTEAQLQRSSMFTNVKFPWIFAPESTFGEVWSRIVKATVFFVLIFYPPYITSLRIPTWFKFFQFWADVIYVADIFVSLLTSTKRQENTVDNFAAVMFARCKSSKFVLDLLSTVWIESFVVIGGLPELYYTCQFNRLIKIYVLCPKWDIRKMPFVDTWYKNTLIQISYMYIVAYVLYCLDWNIPRLTTSYFFGESFCKINDPPEVCHAEKDFFLNVYFAWILEFLYYEYLPNSLIDIYVIMIITYLVFLISTFCESNMVAGFYLKYRNISNYQYFVSNIKKHYQDYKIHPGLLRRLHRYLICHWKYYKGMDVVYPDLLKNEPYDIWFKVHGEVAEKIIKQSNAFTSADPALIKELAYKAKFLILPKKSTILLFGVQCKNVIWTVQGHIKCEYHNEKGELLKTFVGPGELLSIAVFLGKPSLRTLIAYTECEILYIKVQDFFTILKHYPTEWAYFETCIKRVSISYKTLYADYFKKHREYQNKLRDRILTASKSRSHIAVTTDTTKTPFTDLAWFEPYSQFISLWMLARAITVTIVITCASLQGSIGAGYRRILIVIGALCDTVAIVDITLKLFLGYYDKRGLLITDKMKCLLHYLSHGFILDIIGVLPVCDLTRMVMTKEIDENSSLFINTLSKFAHLYLLTGYFDYIADTPVVNMAYVMILKWQVVTLLTILAASHYFVNKCIEFYWDSSAILLNMTRRDNCWLPNYLTLDKNPTNDQLHMVFAESLNLAESGLMRINSGKFVIDRQNPGVGISLFILGLLFWYVMCYSLTLLVLNYRGNTIFQHGFSHLRQFLEAERVEKKLIHRIMKHFSYWWLRTKGINIQNLMNERIGIVFRQDLSHYFFKKTFAALNTMLHGGEVIERQLSNTVTELYFLPQEEIVREMDLAPWVYIVHRGRVVVKKNNKKLAVLTKGSIFGQLLGINPRAVRISAEAEDHADILQIPFQTFRDTVDVGDITKNIMNNPQSKDDYMAIEKPIKENPYNTVQYIIRGLKSIKLPWLDAPMKARNSTWYCRWLVTAWFLMPTVSATITLIIETVPPEFVRNIYWCLVLSDVVHLMNFISEFFTIELIVENGKCVNRPLRWRYFKKWPCYVDILSLILPLFTHLYGNRSWGFARLLRLYLFYEFHKHFCTGFKSRAAPIILKIVIVSLLFHGLTCGWIYIACRDDAFPVHVKVPPPHINETVDFAEWVYPADRKGGCARVTRNFRHENKTNLSFLVPKDWKADYIVALSYILIIYTHSDVDSVVAINLKQVYYKVFINFVISLIYVWVLSVAISDIYTKLRNLYHYDSNVIDLLTYLHHNGLSPVLLKSVKEYTNQLWQRQKGNWLPELAQQAPQCLREDIFGALYIHHIQTLSVFHNLPPYFIRQLVARLNRVVIFPGKFIIQEGDIFSAMYFIHEGEVEKWYTDKSGDKKMLTILTVNECFGLIPGLFTNHPFQFSYYTRTVVDVVVLRYKDWQDLLHGYPHIKQDLYASVKPIKKVMGYDIK